MNKKITLIIGILIGLLLSFGIGIYAASEVLASNIKYKDGTVEDALNQLYQLPSAKKVCKFVDNTYGNKGEIGAKYECDPGDGVTRNFYILKNDNNVIKLIMEKNVTDTVGSNVRMSWRNAIKFFEKGQPGGSILSSWDDVITIGLPEAEDIIAASLAMYPKNEWNFVASTSSPTWWCLGSHVKDQSGGPLYCNSESQQKVAWLFDYTIGCASRGCVNEVSNNSSYAFGYWTNNLTSDADYAWAIKGFGNFTNLSITDTGTYGVRPVITIMESSLYE